LYVFIPRHPERFALVEQLLKDRNIAYQKRSDDNNIDPATKVLIGDSMGEMLAYYSVSYLTVVGGSFTDCGGQNPIESIFMHAPVVFGYSMYNFTEVAKNCLIDGCGIQVNKANDLMQVIKTLCEDGDRYNELLNKCNVFINKYQGASELIFSEIRKQLGDN
jgi:3-deoxy-D-manno-octulosonic-acid transferase